MLDYSTISYWKTLPSLVLIISFDVLYFQERRPFRPTFDT